MAEPFERADALIGVIARNGYEAYVINARLQQEQLEQAAVMEIDLATDLTYEELSRLFPTAEPDEGEGFSLASVVEPGGDDEPPLRFIFYPADMVEGSHPEYTVARMTHRLLEGGGVETLNLACPYLPRAADPYEGFEDLAVGEIKLRGVPDETLRRNYILAFRTMRYSANFHLPIEANSWIAIIRNHKRILSYLPTSEIMDEWRQVEAENLHQFIRLLDATMLLHHLAPEVAALKKLVLREEEGRKVTVLDHTLETMRVYPEELPYDWYGVMACMLHEVGKLYTAERFQDQWRFNQYPRVGSKLSRKILKRLGLDPQDTDLICHLVRYHDRFQIMLNDRGIRRFKALDEYPRLIEMARAAIKASTGNYAAFNHNLKQLERTEVPEEMLEPLLNGNEIMDFASIRPGPMVGRIRQALLQAQIAGDVGSVPEAVQFVMQYAKEQAGSLH